MSQGDLNAKKIETLTKVARLLGDQIQAQGRAINKIQNDVDWIKESLRRITHEDPPIKTETIRTVEEVTSDIFRPEEETTLSTSELDQETTTTKIKTGTSEKEELLQALKIIDNLS